jgi:hypothetical protein
VIKPNFFAALKNFTLPGRGGWGRGREEQRGRERERVRARALPKEIHEEFYLV